ncbi:MAG: hypothetical protein ABIW82_02845 [Dokdonella sp.]
MTTQASRLTTMSFCIVTALSGCATLRSTLYPIAPRQGVNELRDLGRSNPTAALDTRGARELLDGTHYVLDRAAYDRQIAGIVSDEIIYYGSFLAVLGVTIDSRAARNFGGGLAGLASLLSGHYKFGDQRVIFTKALGRVDCAIDSAMAIDPAVQFNDADQLTTQEAAADADMPIATLKFVRHVQSDLTAALQQVALAAPSRSDLQSTLDSIKEKEKVVPPQSTPDPPTKIAIAANVKNLRAQPGMTISADLEDRMLFSSQSTFQDYLHSDDGPAGLSYTDFQSLAALQAKSDREVAKKKAYRTAVVTYANQLDLCLKSNQQ